MLCASVFKWGKVGLNSLRNFTFLIFRNCNLTSSYHGNKSAFITEYYPFTSRFIIYFYVVILPVLNLITTYSRGAPIFFRFGFGIVQTCTQTCTEPYQHGSAALHTQVGDRSFFVHVGHLSWQNVHFSPQEALWLTYCMAKDLPSYQMQDLVRGLFCLDASRQGQTEVCMCMKWYNANCFRDLPWADQTKLSKLTNVSRREKEKQTAAV